MNITDRQLAMMRHALGFDCQGNGRRYRNHYCGPQGEERKAWMELVDAGWATHKNLGPISGGDDTFWLTKPAIDYVCSKRPAPPKLTRSQKRYREFLDADSGMRFGEWLKGLGKRKEYSRFGYIHNAPEGFSHE